MAARQTPPPQHAKLTPLQIKGCIHRLEERIAALEAFDPSKVEKRFKIPEVMALEASIDEALSTAFGHGSVEYERYQRAAKLDHGPAQIVNPFIWRDPDNADYGRQYLSEGKMESLELLRLAVLSLRKQLASDDSENPVAIRPSTAAEKRNVLIVCGRELGPDETIARYISGLGLEVTILRQGDNQERPLIAKLREKAVSAGFAIIVMSPADVAAKATDGSKAQARYSILFELGFFLGALGPERVVGVIVGKLGTLSDYEGVTYIPFEAGEGWKQKIVTRLKAVGYKMS